MEPMQDIRPASGRQEAAPAQRSVLPRAPARLLPDWYAWAGPYAWSAGLEPETCPCRIVRKERALYLRGCLAHRNPQIESLMAAAEWYVFSEWVDRLAARHLVCHAAALERNGAALLLMGKTGAGKSTLAFHLVRRGYRYLGDEFAVIRRDTLDAYAFPKALCLKKPAAELAAPPNSCFEILPYPPDFAVRYKGAVCCLPRESIVPPAGMRFPVRWVIQLDREAGAQALVSTPKWQAAMSIYESSYREGEESFRVVAMLARQAAFWTLGRTEPDRMAERIASLTRE